ncbi:MAG: hypothetical protein AAF737_10345 [Pseudomonadota bacterium]
MAAGLNRFTGQPLEGWDYTVQCLDVTATTQIGTRVLREWFGAINPGLLVRENLTETSIDRWCYALITAWRLHVPMYQASRWEYVETGNEGEGHLGLQFFGNHYPDAHLGDYRLESERQIRAELSAQYVRFFS